MINHNAQDFETKGIDLSCFDKEAMIEKFKHVSVTGINVLILIYKPPIQKKIKSITRWSVWC